GILAEPAVGRPPRWLHVRNAPVGGSEHAQERLGMHRAGADLDVERLLEGASARRPELRQLENEALKRHRGIVIVASRATRAPISDPSPGASQSVPGAPFPAHR